MPQGMSRSLTGPHMLGGASPPCHRPGPGRRLDSGTGPLLSVHSGSEQGGPRHVHDRISTLTVLKVTEVPISGTDVATRPDGLSWVL